MFAGVYQKFYHTACGEKVRLSFRHKLFSRVNLKVHAADILLADQLKYFYYLLHEVDDFCCVCVCVVF